MKKQGSDQAFHDRRHQERKRAEAARKLPRKKMDGNKTTTKQGAQSEPPTSE